MANIVEYTAEIDAPVSVVFDYLDDFTNTKDWMYGLEEFEPVGDQLHGVGATYRGTMKLGVTLRSTLRCTAWEKDRLLEIESIDGIRNTQRWTFTDLGDDRTKVDAWISYSLPGGAAGVAMGRVVKPVVAVAVKQTAASLARHVEASHRGA